MAVVYAKWSAGVTTGSGWSVDVVAGQSWDADDPIVKKYPDMFSDTPTLVHTSDPTRPYVEQATAVPGQHRRR
jgi:hypothetical protein